MPNSTDNLGPQQRTPTEEIGKRVAEGLEGLQVAAFGAGLQDHVQALADHRQRVKDSFKAMAEAAGMSNQVTKTDDGDKMGVLVTGDITTHVHNPMQTTSKPTATAPTQGGLGKLGKLGLATALAMGTGGAGLGAYNLLTKQANLTQGFGLTVEQAKEK